jgi:hypothetical protein
MHTIITGMHSKKILHIHARETDLVIQERDMRGFDDIPRGCMERARGFVEHHIALFILWLNTCLFLHDS